MTLRFSRLDRPSIRRLRPGEKITEHGITAERLKDGDVRYSVNVMVDGERVHRVVGRESDGTTRGICAVIEREREMAQDPDGWIFPNSVAASGHIRSMKSAFTRCVERAGMDPKLVIPHVMRHTAITRLAEVGADIKTIQEFSGHESLEMVLRYAHAQDRAIDRALDRLEQGTVVEHPRARKPQNS